MTQRPLPCATAGDGTDSGRVGVLAGVLFGITGMGSAAVAVTVPSIAGSFDVGPGAAAWIISTYAISLAIGTAVYGRAADRIGIRFTLTAGVLMMAFGALLAAVSPNFATMITARAIQGAGAASVPVLAVALISARYQGSLRQHSLTRMTGAAVTIGATGPLLGGLIEAAGTWRATMCLPALGIVMIIALWGVSPVDRDRVELDLLGAALVVAVSGAVIVLIQSAASGLTALATGGAVFGVSAPLLAFRIRARPHGFIPLALIRTRGLLRTAVTASLVVSAWLALLVTIPAHLSDRGWQPIWIGIALLPSAIPGILGPVYSKAVIAWWGAGTSVMIAASISLGALLIASCGVRWSPAVLLSAMFVANIGWGIGQPALASEVADLVPVALRNQALSLATLIFFIGGGIGSAIAGLGGSWGFNTSLAVVAALTTATVCGSYRIARRKGETS